MSEIAWTKSLATAAKDAAGGFWVPFGINANAQAEQGSVCVDPCFDCRRARRVTGEEYCIARKWRIILVSTRAKLPT